MESVEIIQNRLADLPQGNLTRTTIVGHTYKCLQWYEEGQMSSRVVADSEAPTLKRLIAERNSLERRLALLEGSGGVKGAFSLDVCTGEELELLCAGVSGWRERRICEDIRSFLQGVGPEVCALYGLRRTGKSTAMLHVIARMSDVDFSDTAFVEVKVGDTLGLLLKDMRTMQSLGYRFVFIDEVTLLEDFSEGAAPLADIYARMGVRIVLSGTDSLSFWFAEGSSLFDRVTTVHTTCIPYSEHAAVFGITSIDDYIRYGGTMNRGGRLSRSSFRSPKATYKYVDSAIAHNIQHGLEYYRDGRNMRNLVELWDADELTTAINRVVQQEIHLFARKSITSVFRARELGSQRQPLRTRMGDSSPFDKVAIDVEGITTTLMSALAVHNSDSASIEVSAAARAEVRNWLHVIEVFSSYEVRSLDPGSSPLRAEIVTQPGLRYSQALELMEALRRDGAFRTLAEDEQALVFDTIDSDVLGWMLEEIVIFETDKARGGWQWRPGGEEADERLEVFKLARNALPPHTTRAYEFDMVTYSPTTGALDLYAIEHSDEVVLEQTRHLTNNDVIAAVIDSFHAKEPIGRHVLYRGPTLADPLGLGIDYLNVEEYLVSLWQRT